MTSKIKSKFERIPSGIPDLDQLIKGGFIKGSTILLSGGAGTGKTIFCMQFILEGLKRGENCMFISLEQRPQDLIEDFSSFGWDLEKYIQAKKLFLEYQDPFQLLELLSFILRKIQEEKISRIAIDSASMLGFHYKEPYTIRRKLFELLIGLKRLGVTTISTSELLEESTSLSRFGVEEFVSDAVIILQFLGLGGKASFNLQVRKMRRTEHKKESYPYEITNNGIKVLSL